MVILPQYSTVCLQMPVILNTFTVEVLKIGLSKKVQRKNLTEAVKYGIFTA